MFETYGRSTSDDNFRTKFVVSLLDHRRRSGVLAKWSRCRVWSMWIPKSSGRWPISARTTCTTSRNGPKFGTPRLFAFAPRHIIDEFVFVTSVLNGRNVKKKKKYEPPPINTSRRIKKRTKLSTFKPRVYVVHAGQND